MNFRIEFDDIYWGPGAGFGAWFYSRERKLKIGTVRCIRGVLFCVCYQHGTRFKPETTWIPADPRLNTIENMRHFQRAIAANDYEITFPEEKQTGAPENE